MTAETDSRGIRKSRIFAVFAHPDDETFLAGGTLARYASEGHDVFTLSATRGERGRRGEYERLSTKEFARVREGELQAACRALGINDPILLDCADKQVASACWHSATNEIVRYIRKLKPDVVITFGPDGVSGHPDHVAVSQIVTSAVWGAGTRTLIEGDEPVKPFALYYVVRSASVPSCCKHSAAVEPSHPTTVIDIDGFGSRKLEAVRCYRSQRHLQTGDAKQTSLVLHAPEHFHRVLPSFAGGDVENRLLLPSN